MVGIVHDRHHHARNIIHHDTTPQDNYLVAKLERRHSSSPAAATLLHRPGETTAEFTLASGRHVFRPPSIQDVSMDTAAMTSISPPRTDSNALQVYKVSSLLPPLSHPGPHSLAHATPFSRPHSSSSIPSAVPKSGKSYSSSKRDLRELQLRLLETENIQKKLVDKTSKLHSDMKHTLSRWEGVDWDEREMRRMFQDHVTYSRSLIHQIQDHLYTLSHQQQLEGAISSERHRQLVFLSQDFDAFELGTTSITNSHANTIKRLDVDLNSLSSTQSNILKIQKESDALVHTALEEVRQLRRDYDAILSEIRSSISPIIDREKLLETRLEVIEHYIQILNDSKAVDNVNVANLSEWVQREILTMKRSISGELETTKSQFYDRIEQQEIALRSITSQVNVLRLTVDTMSKSATQPRPSSASSADLRALSQALESRLLSTLYHKFDAFARDLTEKVCIELGKQDSVNREVVQIGQSIKGMVDTVRVENERRCENMRKQLEEWVRGEVRKVVLGGVVVL